LPPAWCCRVLQAFKGKKVKRLLKVKKKTNHEEIYLADGLPGGVFATKRQRRQETEESEEGTNRTLT
jgi:hypothetical protein